MASVDGTVSKQCSPEEALMRVRQRSFEPVIETEALFQANPALRTD